MQAVKQDCVMDKIYFNFFYIPDLIVRKKVSRKDYEMILIDANIFNTISTNLQNHNVMNYLSSIKNSNNIFMITHDLHDWSFGFSNIPHHCKYFGSVSYPCSKMTHQKKRLKTLLSSLHIQSIISIYDCPEFDYIKQSFIDTVHNFYLLHHFICTPIYNLPKVIYKNIDILYKFDTAIEKAVIIAERGLDRDN